MPYDPLFRCVHEGNIELLMHLLNKDIDAINSCDESGQTILHCACAQGEVNIVLYLLQKQECDFHAQEEVYKHTALHIACLYDQQRIVQELLRMMDHQADLINMEDKFGWSALHHAARNGNLEVCRMLVTSGADPSLKNKLGKSALHYGAEHGHLPIITYLYDYVVSSVTPPISSQSVLSCPTLLHCAALNAHNSVAQWLQKRSYPPTAKFKRILDYQEHRSRDQYSDQVADSRNHSSMKAMLLTYRQIYEEWISDITLDKANLDRIKLCICGFPRVGKSAMRESLSKPYLQTLLRRSAIVEETNEGNVERCTFGIEITSMQLSGRDLFSVWDFAGQIENFVTHQFFISTQSTVFTVLINLTHSPTEQRQQLVRWLGFIKMKNLGQITISTGFLEIEKDTVPMPNKKKEGFGNMLQPVPVIIVGSHYDQVPDDKRQETVTRTQSLVNEMIVKFEDYLLISAQLYPLNCLKAVSQEMKVLKDHLCEVRSKLLEVQPLYPRVVEVIARKIEALRVEQPQLKLMAWEDVKRLVKDEVNKLLSERQLCFVLKCLTDAGVLVYFEQGALSNFVFIDPGWLCQEVLGRALAPESFPAANIASVGSVKITEEVLQSQFKEHIDEENVPVIVELLQHFDLCYRLKGENNVFEFPALIETPLDLNKWKVEANFNRYCGRHLVCAEETDSFPPGFFSRLQVTVSPVLVHEKNYHFKGSFIIDALSYQCLVQINSSSTAISLTGRSERECIQECILLLDTIQNQIAGLIRTVCPTLFLKLMIPSSVDLRNHVEPHYYSIHEIIAGLEMVDNTTGIRETVTDLLYMGDEDYRKDHEGKETKVAYIPMETILQVQELLSDGDTDWKDLARVLNLEKYIQLLESRSPESTRLLLLKWAEKPRWTVNSLLWALKMIKRLDVYSYIKARF